MKFGKRLQRERERRGLTQRELGLRVGLTSGTYISQIESGEKLPPLETTIRIAESLGLEDTYPFVMNAVRERSALEYDYLTTRAGEQPTPEYENDLRPLPIRSWSDVAEGKLPTGSASEVSGVRCVVLDGVDDADAFVIQIEDNWMAPVFKKGDMVVVSPSEEAKSGDIALVRIGGKRGDPSSEMLIARLLLRDDKWTDLLPGDLTKNAPRTATAGSVMSLGRIVRIINAI